MRYALSCAVPLLVLSIFWSAARAADIVECKNAKGERSFQRVCPVGSIQISKMKLRSPSKKKDASADIKITIYTTSECGDSCDQVKEFFLVRELAFNEQSVSVYIGEDENAEGLTEQQQDEIISKKQAVRKIQDELISVGGSLSVPTTVIGDAVMQGYNRQKMESALMAAGYQAPGKEQEATP
ncbi:MAG: glutaredoxin family protein [Candidatus Eutrophobiaceae bacterium]